MSFTNREDREPEPIQDWKVEVHPGPPDPPTSMSRAVAGIEQIAQLEARVRELEAERAGWQQEWRAVWPSGYSSDPAAQDEGDWHDTLRRAKRDAADRLYSRLETRTVSRPRPVSEEE